MNHWMARSRSKLRAPGGQDPSLGRAGRIKGSLVRSLGGIYR